MIPPPLELNAVVSLTEAWVVKATRRSRAERVPD